MQNHEIVKQTHSYFNPPPWWRFERGFSSRSWQGSWLSKRAPERSFQKIFLMQLVNVWSDWHLWIFQIVIEILPVFSPSFARVEKYFFSSFSTIFGFIDTWKCSIDRPICFLRRKAYACPSIRIDSPTRPTGRFPLSLMLTSAVYLHLRIGSLRSWSIQLE